MGSRNVERDKPICTEHTKLSWLAKEFPDWALDVFCRGCTHMGRLEPERLLKRLGRSARMGDVTARLKCRRAGARSRM